MGECTPEATPPCSSLHQEAISRHGTNQQRCVDFLLELAAEAQPPAATLSGEAKVSNCRRWSHATPRQLRPSSCPTTPQQTTITVHPKHHGNFC